MSNLRFSRAIRRAPVVVATLAVFGPLVAAQVSPIVFRAEAFSVVGDGVVEVSFDQGQFDEVNSTFVYENHTPVDIRSEATGEVVATLTDVYLFLQTGTLTQVELSFGVIAGGVETDFHIDSPIVRHRSIPADEARGRSTAWFAITDLDDNFAMLQGIGPAGQGAYTSYVNVNDAGDGTQFSTLVNFLYAGQGSTVGGGQNDPPTGYRRIPAIVDSSRVDIAFTMTPNDEATATSLTTIPGRSEECIGDALADWQVNVEDLAILLNSFGSNDADAAYSLDADVNLDGDVDLGDLTLMLSVFGNQCR